MARMCARRGPVRNMVAAALVCSVLLLAACGDDDDEDPVAAAEARVAEAEDALAEAQTAFGDASRTFCEDSEDYIRAVDRYGSLFTDRAVTVGDVKTAGDDLTEPREAVTSSADDVVAARDDVADAEQELADAQAALAEAQTGTTAAPDDASTTTTAPLVPPATVDRVEQAEDDLAAAFEGVTDRTPLTEATAQVNAAAYALQVAWLRLFADAGCLSDEQAQEAVTSVTNYTVALQTALQTAGYYEGEIDGVYGPETVDAVERLQDDARLPVTGLVDRATAAALTDAVLAADGQAATQAVAHTAAVQATLALAGYWDGPVDGEWTPELTTALQAFQTALGVEPTGVVDTATLAALQQAIAEGQSAATSTTTTVPAPSTTAATTTTAEASTTTTT